MRRKSNEKGFSKVPHCSGIHKTARCQIFANAKGLVAATDHACNMEQYRDILSMTCASFPVFFTLVLHTNYNLSIMSANDILPTSQNETGTNRTCVTPD